MRAWVLQDWEANAGRGDAQFLLAWFRLCQWSLPRRRRMGLVVTTAYGVVVTVILGVELLPGTEVGPGLQLPHPHSIVINPASRIGAGCMIRHGVTIGNKSVIGGQDTPSPNIGCRVEVGAGAVIIGDITVCDDARIGANAVVACDVGAGDIVGGVPARVIARVDANRF